MRNFVVVAIIIASVGYPKIAPAETAAEPRVRGIFVYGPVECKKHCGDDAVCFKECNEHALTPDEVREVIEQQKKDRQVK